MMMLSVTKIVTTGTVKSLSDKNGCKIINSECECKCMEPMCNKTCKGPYFALKKNKDGSNECSCLCPLLDCDILCGEIDLGIQGQKNESVGWTICVGCRKRKGKLFHYDKKQ